MRKALYIKEITGSVAGWRFELAHLHTLSDNEVCARLSQITGDRRLDGGNAYDLFPAADGHYELG